MLSFRFALFMCSAAPVALSAQSLREQTRRVDLAPLPEQIISVNPFLPLFGNFQGEYERRINTNLTFGAAGSHVDFGDSRYTNLDAKLRLYPQEFAPMGLGLASSIGFATANGTRVSDCSVIVIDPLLGNSCATTKRTITTPTFAVEGQYQWLLGAQRATAITVGFGVKRYFMSDDAARDFNRVLPTGRLTIGYAF